MENDKSKRRCKTLWEWLNHKETYISDLTSSEKQYPNCYPDYTGPEERQTSSPLENIIAVTIITGVLIGTGAGLYYLFSLYK